MKKINANSFSMYMTTVAVMAVILIIIVIFCVVACWFFNSDSGSASVNDSAYYRSICNLRCIYRNVDVGFNDESNASIYVDTNTGVLYLAGYGSYRSYMSPLYNADGTLKIWKGEITE